MVRVHGGSPVYEDGLADRERAVSARRALQARPQLALLETKASDEAKYMLVTCCAFANFLISNAAVAKLLPAG